MDAHSHVDNVVGNQLSSSVRHQSWSRGVQAAFLAAAMTVLPGLLFAIEPPAWWNDPIKEDAANYFFAASGSSEAGPDAALDLAQRNALDQIVARLGGAVGAEAARDSLRASIRNWTLHAKAEARDGRAYHLWIVVRYPRAEYDNLLAKIQRGQALGIVWAQARSDVNAQRYREAVPSLTRILREYEFTLAAPFELEEAKLLLGDAGLKQSDPLEARRWYEQVRDLSPSERWKAAAAEKLAQLPAAPLCWPLNDRWGGRKVGLCCRIRDEQGNRRYGDLVSALTRDLGAARLDALDITDDPAAANLDGDWLRGNQAARVESARRHSAGLVLIVQVETDGLRGASTREVMGMPVALPDTTVRFAVLRASDGSVHYSGQFRDRAAGTERSAFAERVASLLERKYLVPECPALGAGKDGSSKLAPAGTGG